MLLGIGLFQWMNLLWPRLSIPAAAGQYLIDVNGTALAVGQVVKVVGTIASLSAIDPHFGGVGIIALHPSGNSPNAGEVFFVDPQQVVVGS